MDVDEDDGYSDDDLDALPDSTFRQLQENAIRSTQRPSPERSTASPPPQEPQPGASTGLPTGPLRLPAGRHNQFNDYNVQQHPHQPSSDYGDFDEDMLDGEIFDAAEEPGASAIQISRAAAVPLSESSQRERWRQQRYGLPSGILAEAQQSPTRVHPQHPSHKISPTLKNERYPRSDDIGEAESKTPETDALHAQIVELRQERDTLAKARKAAEDVALSKTGEIAIIRANQKKSERAFEQKLSDLQKLHADEGAKQKLEIERILAEKQKINAEKGFLQNDIAEGNEEIRNLRRAAKGKENAPKAAWPVNTKDPPTTPKKNKTLGHGDGFEDAEIQAASPSKLPHRSKHSTPKGGAKRKRKPAEPSPVKPLKLSQLDHAFAPEAEAYDVADPALIEGRGDTTPSVTGIVDRRFQLTQHLMNHRIKAGGKRNLELLADFSLPSKPATTLSSAFLDRLSLLTVKPTHENFPVALALIVVSMWKECIDEQFWAPVYLLMDLVKFVLCVSPPTTAPLLVDEVLGVIQSTADVNVIPRVRRQPGQLSPAVDTLTCLELLKLIATDCSFDEENIIRFWRCMRFDFVAMILNVVQPINELTVTIGLLQTSVLKKTFAMIVPPNDGKQEPSELNLIDLLSRLLVEEPRPAKDEEPYDAVQIAELRLDILSLMEIMCETKHGGQVLASSQHVIGRLVWVMNDELAALYDYKYGHEQKSQLVNEATRLLFRLRSDFPQLINMQEKLRIIPNSGGVHKHLIALTRLALSEGDFYEEDIEDDVVECAYEMLEDLSSPEEAEALREAFSTARSK